MNNISTQPSSYTAYYGMTREPFASEIEDDLFYAEPSRKQRLDILLHLAQYGNELMLVTGPGGSGKTTLLQQFKSKALDSWSIAHINAKEGIDERKLIQQLYHQMDMKFHGATHSELLENMQHHFDALQKTARQGILLLDNAEQLPLTAINRLLEMAALTNVDNKPLLRVILFGTAELEEKLSDPQIQHPSSLVQRTLNLPPFDSEHTTHYILHRLSAANFAANEPFTENVLKKIFKQSGGWPGRINDLAHAVLADSLASTKKDDLGKTRKPLRIVATIFTIILFASFLIWQDEFNAWFNPAKEPMDVEIASVIIPPDDSPIEEMISMDPVVPETMSPETPISETLVSEKMTPEILPPVAMDDSASISTTDVPADKPSDPEEAVTEVALVDETITEPTNVDPSVQQATTEPKKNLSIASDATPQATHAELNAIQNTKLKTSPETTTAISKDVETTTPDNSTTSTTVKTTPATPQKKSDNLFQNIPDHQDDWLLAQNPNHFTLQLVAGKHVSTIQKFIREHKLHNNLAFYRTIRHKKPWFGLVYGDYTNKQKAIDARSQLPKKLRRLTPWVRTLGGVQKDILKTRH